MNSSTLFRRAYFSVAILLCALMALFAVRAEALTVAGITVTIPSASDITNLVSNAGTSAAVPTTPSLTTGGSISTSATGNGSAQTPSVPTAPSVPLAAPSASTIIDMVSNFSAAGNGSSTASTTVSGSSIVAAVQNALGGTGPGSVSHIGDVAPYIKCVLLAGMGWPIPTFASECSPTSAQATVTIVKNTVGGDGMFTFAVNNSGHASFATTSITTVGGTGTVNLVLDPGTISIDEFVSTGWSQASRSCMLNATSTGSTTGSMGMQFLLSAGQHVICTFVNSFASSTGTGTGGTGTGGTGTGGTGTGGTGTGGSGTGTGGGGSSPSSGTSGGGNGPIVPSAGGNGPIVTGGSPGQVLGTSTSTPGIPNTGVGGAAFATDLMLLVSGMAMLLGMAFLKKTSR